MAALLLSGLGAAAGGSLFGGAAGAMVGRLIGAVAGNIIDRALIGKRERHVEGPRLADLDVMASTEGAPMPRVYGRVRIAGEVIWATKFEEVVSTREDEEGGGKGFGGGVTTTTTTYSYFANFAVGLCEGPIGHIARVWADGKPLDLASVNMRVYDGSQTQTADPLIVAKEGAAQAPAYRGLAYVVFERLALENFGNRLPQLSFEVMRPVGELERMVRAVTLIPGTTEFGYEPATVTRDMGPGQSAAENRHIGHAASDVVASLDELQALCPKLERVAIVVAWFGDDLRAGNCTLQPRVDNADKSTHGASWAVAGLDRGSAPLVSTYDGKPAFGGSPSDDSVMHLIGAVKARGLKVTLYPFVMMDIPAGNALPDPWTGAASQPAYPWRGRITCDPAPGQSGSPDGSAAAATQVDVFFGSSGDWGFRRMILHYAQLAADAGGVDAFLIGSELKSLTRVRSASGVYPVVTQLVALASEVKAIVGSGTLGTYGADWTEYGAHVVDAGADEVRFPLDALWASSSIDAVGIDYYAPLADWRDGAGHLDRALADSIYDRDYLKANLKRGEGYDFYYPDSAARDAQTRSAITDGLGKPWTFRQKDLWSFWSSAHYERIGGAELSAPTAWVPQGKPIWLTEVGCPAVDKGANQPSVFPDSKSSESATPYFSNGARDDLMQRRCLESVLAAFDPQFGATAELNPSSAVYGGRMIDPSSLYLWTWDARPYPAFPAATEVWSDGGNWDTGHWLTGRIGAVPLGDLVSAILIDSGIESFDAAGLREIADGYLVDRPMSARAAIEPLANAYAFDAAERSGVLTFTPRGSLPVAELTEDDLVLPDGAPFRAVRSQETELPHEISLGFTNIGTEYRRAVACSRRLVGGSAHVAHADLAVVTADTAAQRRAEISLQDLWAGRESLEFALPPSTLRLTPGDVVALTINGRRQLIELREVVDVGARAIKARSIDPEVFDLPLAAPRRQTPPPPVTIAPAHAIVLDLPKLDSNEPPVLSRIAVFAEPWPGPVAIWRSFDGASFTQAGLALAPAVVGETLDDLLSGPTSRWDRVNSVRVRLYGGALSSTSDLAVLGGGNAAALRRPDGAWEVLQFANVELIDTRTYRLSRLLRGQAGSEWAIGDPVPAGAPFVLLDRHLVAIARGLDALGRPMQLRVIAASRDHGDPATTEIEVTPQPTALQPLSPAHLRATRDGSGVHFGWTRRSRGPEGDTWDAEVPLGEGGEAYQLEILSGTTTRRTLSASQPAVLYAAADEIADFGSPQTSLRVRVVQLSATVGRGVANERVLTL